MEPPPVRYARTQDGFDIAFAVPTPALTSPIRLATCCYRGAMPACSGWTAGGLPARRWRPDRRRRPCRRLRSIDRRPLASPTRRPAARGEDKTNREIADALVLGKRTVQRHVADLYAKLGARNRAEATKPALGEAGPAG